MGRLWLKNRSLCKTINNKERKSWIILVNDQKITEIHEKRRSRSSSQDLFHPTRQRQFGKVDSSCFIYTFFTGTHYTHAAFHHKHNKRLISSQLQIKLTWREVCTRVHTAAAEANWATTEEEVTEQCVKTPSAQKGEGHKKDSLKYK